MTSICRSQAQRDAGFGSLEREQPGDPETTCCTSTQRRPAFIWRPGTFVIVFYIFALAGERQTVRRGRSKRPRSMRSESFRNETMKSALKMKLQEGLAMAKAL